MYVYIHVCCNNQLYHIGIGIGIGIHLGPSLTRRATQPAKYARPLRNLLAEIYGAIEDLPSPYKPQGRNTWGPLTRITHLSLVTAPVFAVSETVIFF